MKYRGFAFMAASVLLIAFSAPLLGQADAQSFAEGRLALDKYKDCQAAEDAFNRASAAFRNTPGWSIYMARTKECLGKLSDALALYQTYYGMVPTANDVINKIGDLTYQIHRNEIVGTWVGFWLNPNSKDALGRLSRLDITVSPSGLVGTYRQIALSNSPGISIKTGSFALSRSGSQFSISWGKASKRTYDDSSLSSMAPLNSSGTLSSDGLTLKFIWSNDEYDTVVFSKVGTAIAATQVNASLGALDSYVSSARYWMKRLTDQAKELRADARKEDSDAAHGAFGARDQANRDRANAEKELSESNSISADISVAGDYKQLWASLTN